VAFGDHGQQVPGECTRQRWWAALWEGSAASDGPRACSHPISHPTTPSRCVLGGRTAAHSPAVVTHITYGNGTKEHRTRSGATARRPLVIGRASLQRSPMPLTPGSEDSVRRAAKVRPYTPW
jgi:hypothetical protein